MRYFSYTAVDSSGQVSRGSISAANVLELDATLAAAGQSLLSYRRHYLAGLRFRRGDWSRRELIDFIFHLEQLICAGVPLLEALQEFKSTATRTAVSDTVAQLIADIDNGQQLSGACSKHPRVFSPLIVSLINVGEQSGTLDRILKELGQLLKWQDETISRVRSVMIYPAFVAIVLLVVILFVMTWLVPGLVSFVKSAGAELPWHTRALLATSDFISRYWVATLLAMTGLAAVGKILLSRSEAARLAADRLLLRLPLIGPVLFKVKLARFARCVAMMYSAGISVIDTLKHSEGVVDNRLLAGALGQIRQRVIDGEPLSDSFAAADSLPPVVTRMVRVGESTGAIDKAFDQLGYFFDRESKEAIEKLEQGIGPAMIIAVGMIMMWVVVSVIGPIYDLVFGMSGQF